MSAVDGRASLQLVPRLLREHCDNNINKRRAIACTESLLRDLGDACDACNNLPFDDALRDKIATELDRIEAAPPLERMLVTKPPVKRWAELVSRQKDPSIKTRRQAALTAMLRVVDRLPARGPSQGAACPSGLAVGTFHAPR